MNDPDYWKFSNEDGKLERCDMRQFERDLDAAIAYSKQFCQRCGATLTEADRDERHACTQCGKEIES
jgi:ribosomal protein S27AE